MKKLFLCLAVVVQFVGPSLSMASTFVGNGGHAGDVELQVAFREIQDTLLLIAKNKNNDEFKLCTCYAELEGHPTCDILKKLNSSQVEFCAAHLRDHAAEVAVIAKRISSQGFRWTHEQIEVAEEQSLRAADAVTDFKSQSMTVNQDRFLKMKDYERVFLLSHELGHLQKWQDQPIQDNQKLGPFAGKEGGREFLNAVAAAVTMEALDTRVMVHYTASLNRSRGHKNHWIELASTTANTDQTQFGVTKTTGSSLTYRYQFTDMFGVQIEGRSLNGSNNYLSSTVAAEKTSAYSLGFAIRYFPFQDPLSFLGQSHVVAVAGLESMNGNYTISDNYISAQATASSKSAFGSVSYYMPIRYNFWVYAKATALGHHYAYDIPYGSIDFKTASLFNLGVSYGF